MYYISKAPNGNPMVSFQPPVGIDYFEVAALPDGEGALLFTPTGELYREPVVDEVKAEPEPTQLDIIEAQVTYTAMMTDTLLEG